MTLYQYSGSGSLNEFSSSSNNKTVSYNLSSVYLYTTEDFGNVFELQPNGFSNNTIDFSQTTHTFDEIGLEELIFNDYGDLSVASETEDYGPISGFGSTETLYPFGNLTLSGSALTQPNYRLYFSGSAIEKFVHSPDNLSGSLFGFGEKIENRSYDYNLESVFDDSDDYGSVTNISGFIDDYETINQPGLLLEYGLITEPITGGIVLPFGTITLSGSAITQPNYRLYFSGSAIEKFVHHPNNLSGTLFGFGQKIESITFDYNETSISENIVDYGLITNIVNGLDDYGNLSESSGSSAFDNYGLISDPTPTETFTYPFGTLSFSGSSSQLFVKGPYSPSGSIFVFSGSAYTESFTADTPENTQLFTISGSALLSDVEVYVGIGTLFSVGEKVESVTYDYNIDSINPNPPEDFGLISVASTETSNWGLITSAIDDGIDNYGLLVGNPFTSTPFGSLFISGTSLEKDVDSYVGLGTISISDQSTVVEIDSYSGSGSIIISGSGIEKDVDSYVGLGTISLDREGVVVPGLIARTISYVGLGTVFTSGTAIEKFSADTPDNTQLFTLSGTAVEKEVDSYIGFGTLIISGELLHPNIDYTPHYGIEKNIGIGTTGIQLYGAAFDAYSAQTPENTQLFQISGIATERVTFNPPENIQLFTISGAYNNLKSRKSYVGTGGTITISAALVEKDVDSYVGLGTIFLSGVVNDSAQRIARGAGSIFINGLGTESKTIFIPTSGIGTGFIGGTISIFNEVTRYYSPIYPKNSGIIGSGIGTIRINDDKGLTITRAVLPYFARGTIVLSGIGAESFSITNYDGGGLTTLSGISSTREIAVYTAVGSGLITFTSQTLVESNVDAYSGSGSIIISGASDDRKTNNYRGTGSITFLSGASESLVAQTPENTQLFTISGSAADAYSAQTPETEVLYQFSGNLIESRTYGYEGSGQATFSSAAIPIFRPRVFGVGLFRFTTHLSDNLYDTCDSVDVTSDYLDSAFVKFVANPSETTILFNLSGSALTKEIQVYASSGSGIVGISGSSVLKKTKSFVGIGTISITSTTVEKDIDSYVGSGSITILSGSAKSRVSVPQKSTILLSISGTSSTKVSKLKRYVGVGTAYFSGSSSTKVLSRPSYSGIGTIFLSGELVYPNIKYIPTPKGAGVINISGSGIEKLGRKYLPVIQPLFFFSGGFESFSETGYIGIGTIYIQPTSSSTINNPYQIPRVYVTII